VAAVIERDGRFLLVEEETSDGLRLNNPAGHLDPGESPSQAVMRETLEETGPPVHPEALVGVYLSASAPARTGEHITYLRFAFCGRVGEAIPACNSGPGIVRTLWMTPTRSAPAPSATAARWCCNAWRIPGRSALPAR
jgi:ADP-ribose pyrophosphatase YjhB (NUDIX family)